MPNGRPLAQPEGVTAKAGRGTGEAGLSRPIVMCEPTGQTSPGEENLEQEGAEPFITISIL